MTTPAPTDPAATTEPAVPPTPAPPAAPAPAAPAEDSAATIARLEADLKAARAEAGKSRVTAKENAANEARNELAQTIGKALGLIPEGETPDPAKLTEQLTQVGSEVKTAKLELAVFRAAEAAGGDPSALLDSRAFLNALADVDPTDGAAVAAAITAAVAENPRLARPASGSAPRPTMQPNPAQGGSGNPAVGGLAAQIAAAEQTGDIRTRMRLKAQMLADA